MSKTLRKTPGAILLCVLALSSACGLSGCNALFGGNRVVYVPDGEPMRLAEPMQARVWVKGADGKPVRSDNRVPIPEGWWTLADPGEDKSNGGK